MRAMPSIPIRVCSLARQLVYRCDRHTARHKEERRRRRVCLSVWRLLIVTFLTNKRLLITISHLRIEKTRILLQGFLCQWKSLLYSLLLCKSVFYYSELFLTVKFDLCKQRLCCSQMIIHGFEILHLCTVPTNRQHDFSVLIYFQAFQIKIRWIFFYASFQFWPSLIWIHIFNQPQYFPY